MLEEAAGTRMYETKKEAALKTLEKKHSKVDEFEISIEELKQSAEESAFAVKSAEDGAADLKERVEELKSGRA
ncbi:hypothetical protein RJ639_033195 [Escallonia herrerae]|uniref:Uncharacterized protein n=1 Tax=Escallonia herrerae TaxID=1293975 RepID=A0AA88X296_9ASTE|nr:hypothetical protein RJ639_033195 [Escallonia herrerae]